MGVEPEEARGRGPVMLVAYDGGPMSEAQVHLACRSANDLDGLVRIVRVIEMPQVAPLDAPLPVDEREALEASLARAEAVAQRYGARCEIVLVPARSVSEAVLAEARECGAAALFVGLRERRRPGATLLLSRTVRHILRDAPCLVEIAYLPAGVAAPE